MTQTHVDAIVIGGGIVGASLAYELALDRRVVLLEAESSLGYHSTGRSATMFLESYGGPDVRGLTKGSRAFLERPPDGFSTPLMTPRPLIQFAVPGRGHRIRDLFAELDTPGIDVIDADQVRAMCPYVRADAVEIALYEHNSQQLDAHALHQGYVARLRARGGEIRKGDRVTELRSTTGDWRVDTAAGALYAPLVVNAAGAWADEVATAAGLGALGLTPRLRTAFTIAAEGYSNPSGPLFYDIDETFYVKPDGEQFLCSPADRTPSAPCDAKADELEIARALDHIREATTLQARSVRSSWAGLRTFSSDGNLVIGADPRADGFFWSAAQGGYGIQTAPAAARLAAAMIRGEEIPADLRGFGVDPQRLSPARLC